MLANRVHKVLKNTKKLVMMNDAAFPGSHFIRKAFKNKNITTYLLQEGIRFKLPAEKNYDAYGSSGVNYLLSWGETSKEFFDNIVKPKTKVLAIGCPRFDVLKVSSPELLDKIRLGFYNTPINVLFVSNPIDDQGFCSKDEKLQLFRQFLNQLNSMKDVSQKMQIHLRLHNRENIDDYRSVWQSMSLDFPVRLSAEEALYDAIQLSSIVVVLSSTVGLECAMLGKQFGVIKLFEHGYAGDYVKYGVGIPLDVDAPGEFIAGIRKLLETEHSKAGFYVQKALSNYQHAGACIGSLLVK